MLWRRLRDRFISRPAAWNKCCTASAMERTALIRTQRSLTKGHALRHDGARRRSSPWHRLCADAIRNHRRGLVLNGLDRIAQRSESFADLGSGAPIAAPSAGGLVFRTSVSQPRLLLLDSFAGSTSSGNVHGSVRKSIRYVIYGWFIVRVRARPDCAVRGQSA